MPKYHYKPILSVVKESYKSHTQTDYDPGMDIENNVRIIVEAESENIANEARYGFIDINMWELEKTED